MNVNHEELPVQTVSGVRWSVNSDTFIVKVSLDDKPATWQGIVSTVAPVFEPLGFQA